MLQNGLNERQQQILNRLTIHGEVKLVELKGMFDVTEMTLRRDLEKLEQTGTVRRTFGGAILVGKDIALHERSFFLKEEKVRIGQMSSQFIQPGESIFIDGGSTTLQVARFLNPDLKMTVVTNALNIASELQSKHIDVIVVGGILLENTSTLVGPNAVDMISKMAFDRVFIGATGFTVAHGFSNSNMHETVIKRLAIQKAAEVNIVLDHSKFGLKGLFSFADFESADRIITDQSPDKSILAACVDHDVKIVTS
jgi:DeoR family fructose operon transcriptional repressor